MKQEVLWLWSFWREYKWRMVWIVILTALKVLLFLSYPLFFKYIIDGVKTGLTQEVLMQYVIGLLVTGAGSAAVYILLQSNRAMMNYRMEQLMRNQVFRKMLAKDLGFFRRFPVGDVVTRLLDDISDEKLCWFACSGIFRCLEAVFIFVFMILILVKINVTLTLFTVFPLALITLVFLAVERRLHALYHQVQASVSKVNAFLETCFSGIRVLKAYGAEPWQRTAFAAAVEERAGVEIRLACLDSGIHQVYGLMNQIGILLVLWIGGRMVVQGTLSLGDFVAFSTYVFMVIEPMLSIGMFFTRGKQAMVAISRVQELEGAPVQVTPPELPRSLEPFQSLRFENVHFAYGTDLAPVLRGVDLEIRRGEVVGIAGEVGAGKSTLFMMMLRFSDPNQGCVAWNGVDVKEYPPATLRGRFAWVPQEALLFSDTVRANIAFERPMTGERVEELARLAEMTGEIAQFPNAYEQPVGQRGLTLSGGQKQRLSLARALGQDSEILLLDDLTAAVDARTEEKLWRNLLQKRGEKTLIVISHRWATLQNTDRILVFDQGRIIESGTPQALIEKQGYLFELVQRERVFAENAP